MKDAYDAENVEQNIISYGMLEAKGYIFVYRGEHHVLARLNAGTPVLDVEISKNVLVISTKGGQVEVEKRTRESLVIKELWYKSEFYCGLAHLNCDTIIRIAQDPDSGILRMDQI